MEKSITMTVEELYFLGCMLKAKYMDYRYIAAMSEIQKDYEGHKQDAKENLEERGFLTEDFSGNITVSDEIVELMKPVLFSGIEGALIRDKAYQVYTGKSRMVLGHLEGNKVTFRTCSDEDLLEMLTGEVTVQCARVNVGAREEHFTAEQMQADSEKEKALQILKGEF